MQGWGWGGAREGLGGTGTQGSGCRKGNRAELSTVDPYTPKFEKEILPTFSREMY